MSVGLKISVVVPVYRDWDKVNLLLRALEKQTLHRDAFEVILVDNESHAGEKLADLPIINLNLLHARCETPGSYAARNVGWKMARALHVAFTDADCVPTPVWLEEMLAAVTRWPNALIAGDVKISELETKDRRTLYTDYDRLLGLPQQTYVSRGYAVTANLCVPHATLQSLGGFDEARFSGGDAELCFAAKRKGHALIFSDEACVEHPARPSFSEHFSKLQRVRGGQLASGSLGRRCKYAVRTSLPPIRRTVAVLRAQETWTVKLHGLTALYILWIAGFAETARLLCGGKRVR